MKIGKAKPVGTIGVKGPRKVGDPDRPPKYTFGRPSFYREEYCQSIIDYFAHPESWEINVDAKGTGKVLPKHKIPTVERWCHSIGVSTRTLDGWQKVHPEFAEAYQMARGLQQSFAIELAAAGIGTSLLNVFMQTKHDWQPVKEETPADNLAQQLAELIGKMPS